MSRQNSIQKRLLEDVTSLKKVLVECEINGWMETSQKQAKNNNKLLFKPKRIKHHSTKLMPISQHQLSTINDQIERDVSCQRLVFDKKSVRNFCSNDREGRRKGTQKENNMTAFNEQLKTIPQTNIKTKPFNSGYILKELRKKVKQRNYFKKFQPQQIDKSSYLDNLNTKESIRYFQSHFRKIQIMSCRNAKASLIQ